jgi:hypothetical protein
MARQPMESALSGGSAAAYSAERDGRLKPDHADWTGFKARTAAGLVPELRAPRDREHAFHGIVNTRSTPS